MSAPLSQQTIHNESLIRPDSTRTTANRTRVLIADDHGILRAGIAMLLAAQSDMELVGEASTCEEAVRAVDRLRPDVVLMDLAMPEMDGFKATRTIKLQHPDVAVLILSMYDGEEDFFRALEAGASGFVPKRAASTELVAAIRSITDGDVFLYPSMAKALLTKYLKHTPANGEKHCNGDKLTEREQEVLRLIADGLPNRDIAGRLGVSESTIERHRANIMEKLDLHSRTDLIKYAVRKGIVQVDHSVEKSAGSGLKSPSRKAHQEQEVRFQ
ncbi:MAG: response regulator transcription factor [Dehalococcoidia bacterium]|nr:response regulator transcription factor [Dehalococcoidia bacterium]